MHVAAGKKKEKLPRRIEMSPGSLPRGRYFEPKTKINPAITKSSPVSMRIFPICPKPGMQTFHLPFESIFSLPAATPVFLGEFHISFGRG